MRLNDDRCPNYDDAFCIDSFRIDSFRMEDLRL